jgi:uncharacterized protein YqhQ
MQHEESRVGGQAVIEGVMMRAPGAVAVAVRDPSGEIVVRRECYVPLSKRFRPFGLPILRGVAGMIEMLSLGMSALNYSALVATGEQDTSEEGGPGRFGIVFALTSVAAIALGIGFFFYLPLYLTERMPATGNPIIFNLVDGIIRLVFFFGYLVVISLMPELKKVFAYHGAEHKSVSCYEAGEDLVIESARRYSTRHPRCGTSLLLVFLIVAIVVFGFVDGLYAWSVDAPLTRLRRFGIHILLLPLVLGGTYEFLRLAGRRRESRVLQILSAPGLALQRLTTREPTDDQLEVGLISLKEALAEASRCAND